MQLIVGLGNPEPAYAGNRHNAGLWFMRRLCAAHGGEMRAQDKFFGETGAFRIADTEIRLLWPTTYMNLSGRSVAAMCNFYRIAPESMLVAYDEIDLEVGDIRFKAGGGHGGHNGLRSIIESLGGQKDFRRLRIGIGHPGHKSLVTNYVLGNPPAQEVEIIENRIDDAIALIPGAVAGDWEEAMRILHTRD
ncbi:MAG: aminoacyl-tRNA hydrolase [Gammaproteobacteria bacterium]|nr:aminoacyl-tRNA hydrolase [Gammaproteobacteria bacterium]MXX05302.1 aminoacyl-tRNA hydrolase [Gammaproteobacteria bacterium]MYE30161.1 aminoacyl-tRNA hydrolase [Gammaproteobacteria bacterium]